MAQIEVNETTLVVRAEDEGVQGVLIEGSLAFDPRPTGIGAVLELRTAQDSEWTPALRSFVARSVLNMPVRVRHDGVDVILPVPHNTHGAKALKSLQRMRSLNERSIGGPRLIRS